MFSHAHSGAMPCHYPLGQESDWCERHRSDHAMLRALREEMANA